MMVNIEAFWFEELRKKQTHQPINHSREPLPGAEGCHVFQLLVSDPGWHQELLRVAGAKPVEERDRESNETKVSVCRHLIWGWALSAQGATQPPTVYHIHDLCCMPMKAKGRLYPLNQHSSRLRVLNVRYYYLNLLLMSDILQAFLTSKHILSTSILNHEVTCSPAEKTDMSDKTREQRGETAGVMCGRDEAPGLHSSPCCSFSPAYTSMHQAWKAKEKRSSRRDGGRTTTFRRLSHS